MLFSSSRCQICFFSLVLPALNCAAQQVYVQTSDPRIQYSPNWNLTQGKASHIAYDTGATASFSFEGTYIGLRSTRSSTQGIESITLDGLEYLVNCSWRDASVSATTVIVFEKGDLTPTLHSIKFTKTSPPQLAAVVWDFLYVPLTGAVTAIPAPTSSDIAFGVRNDSNKSSEVSGATIGGAVGAAVLFLVLLALLAWLLIRRRRRSRGRKHAAIHQHTDVSHGGDSDRSKEDPLMMRSVAGHPGHLTDYAAVQRYPEHMYPANAYPAKSIDDTASMLDEDALTPAQQYALQTRSQSQATEDTVSIAPSSRAQSTRDRPPTYITSRTRAMGRTANQPMPSIYAHTPSHSSVTTEQSDSSRQRLIQEAKLADMSNNNVAGVVLLEDPSPSVMNAFSGRNISKQDEKMAQLDEGDTPGGAVLLEDPSPSLRNALAARKKRSVQDEKVAHLMENDVPGAVLLEDPSPSLRHGFRHKG